MAERFSYGTPVDRFADTPVPLVQRATTALVGRVLIAAIFLVSGFAKLTDGGEAAGYMTKMGIPHADILAVVAGCAEILGGLAVMFGFLARVGAAGLVLFMIPTTMIFHGFWKFDGAEVKTQMVNFMKNLAIIGGLLSIVAFGPGRFSFDAKVRKPLAP